MMRRWAKGRVHVSWLVAAGCIGMVVGVTLVPFESVRLADVSWLLTGSALLLFACTKARYWVVPFAFMGGMLIGVWRGSVEVLQTIDIRPVIGQTVELSGVVTEDTDVSASGDTTLRLALRSLNKRSAEGTAWVAVAPTSKIRRSDSVTVEATVSEGFGRFTLSAYRAQVLRVERPDPGDVALTIRDWFAGGVEKAVTSPQSDLGLGYLLGQRRGLPPELDTALQVAGLTHVVVASGYNLTILVRFARRLLVSVSKYASFLSASAMILGFIAITGISPSMSRAGLVAGVSLVAWYYGRRLHPLVLLPFAMAVTVLFQPSYAWGDVGWQLSFAAFAGVMILAPLLQAYFFADLPERTLRRIFVETIAAQLATLPILLVTFGQVSVVAPIANLLILPLVPFVMALTFFAGVIGVSLPVFATAAGMPAELVLGYMTSVIRYVGDLSWALAEVAISPSGAALFYVGLIAVCFLLWRVTRTRLEQTNIVE